jgi:hypothetical protein
MTPRAQKIVTNAEGSAHAAYLFAQKMDMTQLRDSEGKRADDLLAPIYWYGDESMKEKCLTSSTPEKAWKKIHCSGSLGDRIRAITHVVDCAKNEDIGRVVIAEPPYNVFRLQEELLREGFEVFFIPAIPLRKNQGEYL